MLTVTPPQKATSSVWHQTASYGEAPILEICSVDYFAITSSSTLTWSGSTCEDPIYRSNKSV